MDSTFLESFKSEFPKVIGGFLTGYENSPGFQAHSTVLLLHKGGQLYICIQYLEEKRTGCVVKYNCVHYFVDYLHR